MGNVRKNLVPAIATILVGVILMVVVLFFTCSVHAAEKGETELLIRYATENKPFQITPKGGDEWILDAEGLPLKNGFQNIYFVVHGVANRSVSLLYRRATKFPKLGLAVVKSLRFVDANVVDGTPEKVFEGGHTLRLDGEIVRVSPEKEIPLTPGLSRVFDKAIKRMVRECGFETI